VTVWLRGVSKRFTRPRDRPDVDVRALDSVTLDVETAELMVVVGPSGSGKTTMLRCVAGLEAIDDGTIEIGGRDVTGAAPADRDIAMVFQDFALFPHMDVAANIGFGLRARKVPAAELRRAVAAAAETVHLEDRLSRYPAELSGGERQRVALARALVRDPSAFLMDEPLSNLDAEARARMRLEIKTLQRAAGVATLYVTHDQVEALTMGDRVAVLRAGRIEQIDTPMNVYDHPASAFVARFIGSPPMNLFPAELLGPTGRGAVRGLRPEAIAVVAPGRGRLRGRVHAVESTGADVISHIDVDGHRLLARTPREVEPTTGDDVGLDFPDEEVHEFESSDGPAVS
jgi:ABC-type sugar transport system ATPase subunit